VATAANEDVPLRLGGAHGLAIGLKEHTKMWRMPEVTSSAAWRIPPP